MSSEARAALGRLVAALEHHYNMACNADIVQPSVMEDAEARLQDAFFTYDDVLFTSFGIELPLELVDDYEDEEDEEGEELVGVDDIDADDGIVARIREDDGVSLAGIFDEN